jgi:hypothetical protein
MKYPENISFSEIDRPLLDELQKLSSRFGFLKCRLC